MVNMNKTKTFLILSGLALVPLILSTLLMAVVSFDYWLVLPGYPNMLTKFLAGECNNKFGAIVFSSGLFSMCIIVTTHVGDRQEL